MLPDISSGAAKTGATQASIMQKPRTETTTSRKIFIGPTLSGESATSRGCERCPEPQRKRDKKSFWQAERIPRTLTFITSDNICHIKSRTRLHRLKISPRLCCLVHLRIWHGTKERNTDTAA